MSSLYSDPSFRRGSTALGFISTDNATTDTVIINGVSNTSVVEGRSIVGQVKVFQDVNPTTGVLLSDRLVYCVAARWKGSDVSDASTIAGNLYVFDAASAANQPLVAFENFSAVGTSSNITNASVAFGVLDEYLTGYLRTNDIVWLVVKGPCSVRVTSTSIAANGAIAPATGGNAAVWSTGLSIGQNIGFTNAAAGLMRANITSSAVV